MAFEIVDKSIVSDMIRMPASKIRDEYYDMAIGQIQLHTGWRYLNYNVDLVQIKDGDDSFYLQLQKPVNTVSYVKINNTPVPSAYYVVRWDGIYMKTEPQSVDLIYETSLYSPNCFSLGIGNIEVSYNCGGIANLPYEYQEAIKLAIILIIQTLSTLPREEGSDQILRNYKPQNQEYERKDESQSGVGIHGKIRDIIFKTLPRRIFAK